MPYGVNASLPPVFTHDLAIGSKLVVFRLGITKFWHAKIVFSNLSGAHAIAPTRVEDRCCCTWSVTSAGGEKKFSAPLQGIRSEEGRVGTECVSKCKSRWWPD